jgi:hypothetical protein
VLGNFLILVTSATTDPDLRYANVSQIIFSVREIGTEYITISASFTASKLSWVKVTHNSLDIAVHFSRFLPVTVMIT